MACASSTALSVLVVIDLDQSQSGAGYAGRFDLLHLAARTGFEIRSM
jgi:hypothetical protein